MPALLLHHTKHTAALATLTLSLSCTALAASALPPVGMPARLSTPDMPAAQSIRGRITDKASQPLPGVTVLVQGSNYRCARYSSTSSE